MLNLVFFLAFPLFELFCCIISSWIRLICLYKTFTKATIMQKIALYCLTYFFQDYLSQNITIYESFQKKSTSSRIIVLMIVMTLMKVRRERLSFAWLPWTFRYQNTSAQPLILLNFFLPPRTGWLKTVLLNWYLTYLAWIWLPFYKRAILLRLLIHT